MSGEELRALLASAVPGARVTIVTVELPGPVYPGADPTRLTSSAEGPVRVPRPVDAAALGAAPAIAQRQEPFTCAELAAVLRVEPDTVSGWCRTGALPGAAKVGRAGWRIPPSAVLAMLARSGQATATPTSGGVASAASVSGAPPASEPSDAPGEPVGTRAASDDTFDIVELEGWRRDPGRRTRA